MLSFRNWTGVGVVSLAAMAPFTAHANGFDRVMLPPALLFEEGNYLEFSFSYTRPDVEGTFDPSLTPPIPVAPGTNFTLGPAGAQSTGNIAKSFTRLGAGIKFDYGENWSFAARSLQPYGQNGTYSDGLTIAPPLANIKSAALRGKVEKIYAVSGLTVDLNINAIDFLARYKFSDEWSAFGGPRSQRLSSGAIGSPSGSGVYGWDDDTEVGFVLGAGYENQATYTQVMLTYTSAIDHQVENKRIVPGNPAHSQAALTPGGATISTPESFQLTVRQPLSPEWAVFGSARHAKWSDANIVNTFTGGTVDTVTTYPDVNNYSLGVGHAVSDKLALSLTGLYQTGDEKSSLFAPRNDVRALSVGLQYQVNNNMRIRANYTHSWLDDAQPAFGTLNFDDSTAQSIAVQIGYSF
ncbi:outer membrane protein transport protein [Planktomarina temperata]|nr:outer membrane protein transport protein [Planktomarina temperata]